METVRFSYNNTEVDFLPIGNDSLMINATQMAKIFGKKVNHFNENESTENFINACLNGRNSGYLNFNKREDLIISKIYLGIREKEMFKLICCICNLNLRIREIGIF